MNSHWKAAEEIAGIVNEICNPEEEITDERLAEAEETIISLARDIANIKEDLTRKDQTHRMCKLFPILSLAREDIVSIYQGDEKKEEEVEKIVGDLTDSEMKYIADKMYDGCFEGFYEDLNMFYEDFIKEKKLNEEKKTAV